MRDTNSLDWNANQVAMLRAMHAAGATAREIGKALGVTRNAVIGKSRRLGLSRGIRPKLPKPRVRRRKPPRSPAPKFPFLKRTPPKPPGPVHFRALEAHHCRWIPGQPESQLYCGEPKVHGSSWCLAHFKAAYSRSAGDRA
jgi:GcrA cell cycle regulator